MPMLMCLQGLVEASPLFERTAADLSSTQQLAQGDLGLFRPRTNGVNNFIANGMENPALF